MSAGTSTVMDVTTRRSCSMVLLSRINSDCFLVRRFEYVAGLRRLESAVVRIDDEGTLAWVMLPGQPEPRQIVPPLQQRAVIRVASRVVSSRGGTRVARSLVSE